MHRVHDELLNKFDSPISNNNNEIKVKYIRSPYIEVIIPLSCFNCIIPPLPGKGTMYEVVDSTGGRRKLEVHWSNSIGTIVGPLDKEEEKDIQFNDSDKILITGYRNIFNLETLSSNHASTLPLLGKTVSWEQNINSYRFNGRFDREESLPMPKISKMNILLEELFLLLVHIETKYYSKNVNILVQDKNGFLKRVIPMNELSKTIINYLLE